MGKYMLRILKFSYDRLNDELLKQCFLSCVVYPEDEDINNEALIEEWIMEGMLDDVGNEQWLYTLKKTRKCMLVGII